MLSHSEPSRSDGDAGDQVSVVGANIASLGDHRCRPPHAGQWSSHVPAGRPAKVWISTMIPVGTSSPVPGHRMTSMQSMGAGYAGFVDNNPPPLRSVARLPRKARSGSSVVALSAGHMRARLWGCVLRASARAMMRSISSRNTLLVSSIGELRVHPAARSMLSLRFWFLV